MVQRKSDDLTQTASPVFHRDVPVPCLHVLASPDRALVGASIALPREHIEVGRGDRKRSRLGGRRLDITDEKASRIHAVLHLGADVSGWSIRDLSSKNGTWRNGRPVGFSRLELHDVFRIGDTLFLLCPYVLERSRKTDRKADGLVGVSSALVDVRDTIRQVGSTDRSVLVTGESGTGKELVARALHRTSERTGPFLALNCAAIPPDLVESELFGVVRGAFSGAVADRNGWIVEAHGGTLFLDEIGDMSVAAQAKLLRVLETREVTPVGGRRARQVDVRFIAATNQDLAQRIERGYFRLDLLQRLEQFVIRIAPLRERREDIPVLWEHFGGLQEHATPDSVANVLEALLLYPWPGNVRELKNAASQLVVRGSGGPEGWIAVHHLPPAILEAYRDAREASPDASPASTAEAPPSAASDAPDEHGDADARPPREQLLDALERHNWNISAVAREFDRHRPQIYRWMRYLGIDPKGDG